MFVKVKSGVVEKYPYTVGDLRRDNPNTSFPRAIPEATMARYDMHPVVQEPNPSFDPLTQKVRVGSLPVLQAGVWIMTKSVVAFTSEQIAVNYAAKAKEVRAKRDKLLAETDWVVIMHTEKGTNIPLVWEVYRQALRDITGQSGFPHSVTMPVKPEV